MLNTIKATLHPSGMLAFEEVLPLDHPVPVLVTLLEEGPTPAAQFVPPGGVDPLDWPLTDEQRGVWEEFPKFRAEHPLEPMADEAPERQAFWRRLLALREQAIAEGMPLMDWDEIDAEVRRRRGGVADE